MAPKGIIVKGALLGRSASTKRYRVYIKYILLMITAKFNRHVHDQCDPPAREAVTRYLKDIWNLTATGYELYKVDLLVENHRQEKMGYAEVEMRDWEDCPFATIHIPQRKKKLFGNDMRTIYFVVNRSLTRAWYINTNDILSSPLREIPNKRIAQGECFYDVPKEFFTEITLIK